MNIKPFFLSIILLFSAFFSLAQERSGFGMMVGAGGSYTNQDKLNLALKGLGYTKVNPNFTNINLAGIGLKGNWVYGMDVSLLSRIVRGLTFDSTQTYNRMLLAIPKVGYAFYHADEMYVYPALGVGGGGSFVRSIDPNSGVLKKFNGSGACLDASLNVLFWVPIIGDESNVAMVQLGGGYIYAFTPWNMNLNGVNLAPIPSSPTGPYFRLSFGMAKQKD